MRLIDADKLTTDLIENKSFYPAIVKRAIEEAPTEDVVPRAEVERWQFKYKADIETCDSTIHRLQNILLQFTDIVHKWGAKNNIDTTEISLVPILEQEADSIIEKAKQEVAKELITKIKEKLKAINREIANGKIYVCNEDSIDKFIEKFEKKYIGE